MTLIDAIKQTIVGKKVRHKNQHYREVVLEVEDVILKSNHIQITPDTRENDWWGQSCDWETIELCFVDGSKKEYSMTADIDIVEE